MSKQHQVVEWASGANVYEVNIRQYTPEGSFESFRRHLPRLKRMGVEILWLMPVTPISREKRLGTLGSYYACSSYTSINPEFGSMEDFKQLVHAVHELGMKLIIDWVANHTGYDHHWTTEHPDWYRKDQEGNFVELNGWNDVIDLDYTSKALHQGMIDAMRFWVTETGIDGFRCDMAHLVPLDFWSEARRQCDALRPLFWLAECDEMAYSEVFDVSYAWQWMHATEKYFRGQASITDLRAVLQAYAAYPPGATKLYFTTNHDENSWNGTEYEKYGDGARALAVFSATWAGMPLVYSGQEIPHRKRLLFFEKDAVQWTFQPLLEGFYQSLFAARRHNKALHAGAGIVVLETQVNDLVLAYLRVQGSDRMFVVLNLSATGRLHVQLNHAQLAGTWYNIFSGLDLQLQDATVTLELQAYEYLVYSTVRV